MSSVFERLSDRIEDGLGRLSDRVEDRVDRLTGRLSAEAEHRLDRLLAVGLGQVERGRVPDPVVRAAIRRLLGRRLAELGDDPVWAASRVELHLAELAEGPIAVETQAANDQHYEVPAAFFELMLGPHRKYSACAWPPGVFRLEDAEAHSLAETLERAEVRDGQRVLELGCGWGSLSLFAAQRHPTVQWTAVSNSASQRAFIEGRAAELGLSNLRVITADMNTFEPPETGFDRVVSVEMFEHMRNWPALLQRIRGWLKRRGKLFVHHFSHWQHPYLFEDRGPADWMSREFFSGGQMPYDRQLDRCQQHLRVEARWRWSGPDYSRTLEAWLMKLDQHRDAALATLAHHPDPARALQRWRVFLMACSELFNYDSGRQWGVTHVRMVRP